MYKEILISIDEHEVRVALIENKILEELFIERIGKKRLAGSICKGKVRSIVPGIQAAFVDIGLEKDGFLYVDDVLEPKEGFEDLLDMSEEIQRPERGHRLSNSTSIVNVLKKGQEILVQVVKEPMGTKGARLSSYITLPGRFLVLMPTVDHVGISRKISDDKERERLKELLCKLQPSKKGIIVRTMGEGKGEKEFRSDLRYLTSLWQRIERRARNSAAPQLIHEEIGLMYRVMRDLLTSDINKIIIDSKGECNRLQRFIRSLRLDVNPEIVLYTDETPLFKLHNLEKEVDAALQRKVWLKSGGYIDIEQTEALVAIDVNTGRHTGKGDLEKTILGTNLEAASEIARQLRLRDMGGIIIIDFIDMEEEKNRQKVLKRLETALKRDRSRTNILQLTELGLVEMTRQRVRHSLENALCQDCPYCGARGLIKSVETKAIEVMRELKEVCIHSIEKEMKVIVHPDIATYLQHEGWSKVDSISRSYHKKIKVEGKPEFHREESQITAGK